MRIGIIAPPWVAVPPDGYGGTELVLDGLCRGLAEAGHDVFLYATGDSTCPVERASTFPEAIGIESLNPVAELRHVMEAYEAMHAWGAEIVHDHTVVGLAWADRYPHFQLVTTNHGPFDADLSAVYAHLAIAVPVVAISHHQAASAKEIPIAAVIHHGVDLDGVPVGDGDGGFVLFLGRMNPDKGVHTAIEVARRASMPLVIAAKMREPAEREYFETFVRPNLGEGAEYAGEVGTATKRRLLAEARCLVNPIAWPEPFGMVVVEALAAGTPVVATPLGAIPELVDDGVTGFLRTSIDDLAAAVGDVGALDRGACRRAAEERFSIQRMAANHVALYERLLTV